MSIRSRWDKDYADGWDAIWGQKSLPKCSNCFGPCDNSMHGGLDWLHPGVCCKCDEAIRSIDFIEVIKEYDTGLLDGRNRRPPVKLSGDYYDGYNYGYKDAIL